VKSTAQEKAADAMCANLALQGRFMNRPYKGNITMIYSGKSGFGVSHSENLTGQG